MRSSLASAIGHAHYGQAALRAGDGSVAERELKRAVDLAPGLEGPLAGARRLDEAEAEYREALRLHPDYAGVEENLGVLYKWRGDLRAALPHFRKANALDPDLSAAACDLAGALATLGQTQEALTLLSAYRPRHPEDHVAADLERAIRADSRE